MNKFEKFGLTLIFVSDIAQGFHPILGFTFFVVGVVLFVFGDDLKVDEKCSAS